ncbi:MAG: LPS-assembly protein LptD, partial [Gammaproteobacteria bacterium]
MRFYLFLLLFWVFLTPSAFAGDALWNCYQDKKSQEWVCTGEKGPTAENAAPLEHKPEPAPQPELQESEVEESAPKTGTAAAAGPAEKQIAETAVRTPPAAPKGVTVKEKLYPEESRTAGWKCKAADGSESWDCNLTGPDPKGEAHIVASEEKVFSLLGPAFDAKQEQVFNTLASNLKYDPWANCSIEPGAAPAFTPTKDLRDVSPLDVKANYGEVFDNEISSYEGNVEILRADQRSLSHTAQYDSVSQTLDLQGEVYYSEDNLSLYSNSASLKLASDQATLRNVQFIEPAAPLRGRAAAVYRDSKTLSRYKDVAYTSCPPGNSDWVVHASDLKLNDETGKGAAKNAWLEFKGVPVFYSPYLSFPVDKRRLSGFLAPSFGNTQQSGFNLSVPYYWNIAPNYDATLKPRYYGKRGLMLGGDFRLLTQYSNSSLGLE